MIVEAVINDGRNKGGRDGREGGRLRKMKRRGT